MGHLEKQAAKTARRKNLQRIILGTVAATGLMSVALLAPNVLQILPKLGFIDRKKRQKEFINQSRERLLKAGLLTYNEQRLLRLTPKGEAKLRQFELVDFKLNTPKRWDKKWRILIFDVREERRPLREKIRRTLTTIGFSRLQDSVWVYPFDCEDLITLLKADFRVGKDLIYIIAESIENEARLLKKFNLAKK